MAQKKFKPKINFIVRSEDGDRPKSYHTNFKKAVESARKHQSDMFNPCAVYIQDANTGVRIVGY